MLRAELAGKLVLNDVTVPPSAGNIRSALANLSSQTHLVHESVDEFVVDYPALVAQVKQYSPAAKAMLVALKALPDRVFEHGVLI